MIFDEWFKAHGMPLQAGIGYSLEDVSRRAWDAATAAERERCAKICEDNAPDSPSYFEIAERLRECATEIRRA